MRELRVAAQLQVEIADALTLNSQFLICDKPTAALGAYETERLFEQIGRLKAEGVSFIFIFIYISHRLGEIARIADRVAVLSDGRLVATHYTAQVPVKMLVEQMVGRPLDRMFPAVQAPAANARPVLEVVALPSAEGAFADISFSLRNGEVFGVAGIVGAGRTELMRAISGADLVAPGIVKVDGETVRLKQPSDALVHGVVMVPEDCKNQALILPQTIGENLALGNFARVAPSGWITRGRTQSLAGAAIKRFLARGTAELGVNRLSAGNQQKVMIAKNILLEPKVPILDEPTRGIDVGARGDVRNRCRIREGRHGRDRGQFRPRRGVSPRPSRHGAEPRAQSRCALPRSGGACSGDGVGDNLKTMEPRHQ